MQFDRWLKGYWPYLILILLGCLFYLPGLKNLPVTDRDEARFAQASRQMLKTGNFIDIRFQNTPRYKKPIGIYWMQAACAAMAGGPESNEIWPYRIPSLLGAMFSILLTFYFARFFFGPKEGFHSAVLLGSSLLLNVDARIATTDAALLASIILMQGMLGVLYVRLKRKETISTWVPMVFWAACGIGILLKGPLPIVIALLTIVGLSISDKSLGLIKVLRPLRGLSLMLAIILPWFIAINLASRGAFLKTAVSSDLLPKLIGGQESHGAPPGYYLFQFPALFWPASLVALWSLWASWKVRENYVIRFLLAWIIPFWIVLEVVPTKLPHYILPIFPAVAILTGGLLFDRGRWEFLRRRKSFRRLKWISTLVWVVVSVALVIFALFVPAYFNHEFFAAEFLVILGVCFVLASVLFKQGNEKPWMILIYSIVGCILVIGPGFSQIFPRLKGPWISRDVARMVQTLPLPRKPVLVSVGFHEPSLVFLLGTNTRLGDIDSAVEDLEKGRASLALIDHKVAGVFMSMAGEKGLKLTALRSFRGFNYSNGKWMRLTLYKAGVD